MSTRISRGDNNNRKPVFAALTADQCHTLLARNHVGRVAFFNHGYVDIEPVHYVAEDPWLFVRSAVGTKLEVFAHHPYVAFEVEEVEGPFDWQSVVVRGTVYLMGGDGASVDRAIYEKALSALRTLMPAALTEDDPVPGRRQLYGIHIDALTGRAARHRVPARSARRASKAQTR